MADNSGDVGGPPQGGNVGPGGGGFEEFYHNDSFGDFGNDNSGGGGGPWRGNRGGGWRYDKF